MGLICLIQIHIKPITKMNPQHKKRRLMEIGQGEFIVHELTSYCCMSYFHLIEQNNHHKMLILSKEISLNA